ncbi:MAG: hypothetical protein QF662_04890 [Phycisphaerae bacterium]|nr:hypothetical protein [Candidatus Pacearchaeota archaeon]MDP6380664.1 hypothetical protein [Phycisphaerae bacterium]
MSKTLTQIEKLAVAKAVNLQSCNDETALPPGTDTFVSFTAEIEGHLSRGPSSTRAATNRARSVPTICLLLQELGCTREYAPDHIIQLWNDLSGLSKKAMESRLGSMKTEDQVKYQTMLTLFDTEIVDNIPRIDTKGYVKFDGTIKKA